jgi:polysaccharide biosynthesis transport protein
MNQEDTFPVYEKEIHIRDYLRIISRRRHIVMTTFLIILAMVLMVTFLSVPLYEASSKIVIEKKGAEPLVQGYGYAHFEPEFYKTQAEIIKSSSVALKVVKQLNLEETYDSFFKDRTSEKTFFSREEATPAEDDRKSVKEITLGEEIAQDISEGVRISPVRDTKVLEISFTSENPVFARMIVNAVIRAYVEQALEMDMKSTEYSIKWMTEKANEERAKLEKAEIALQDYMKSKDIVTIENRVAIVPEKLTDLNSQLTLAEARRKDLESLAKKVTNTREFLEDADSVMKVSSNSDMINIRQQIQQADQNVRDLSKKYGYKHPKIIRAVTELDGLQQQRAQIVKRVVRSVQNEYDLALEKETELKEQLERMKDQTVGLNEKLIQYGMLKREVEANQVLYDSLIKRIKEKGVTEQVQTIDVSVLDEAKEPVFPSKPNKKRNIMLGIILGLFGGIGLAFFIEYLDNTIKSPDDVEEEFGVPVLGVISLWKDKDKDIENVVVKEPNSLVAESYRSIRTAVELSSVNSTHRRLVVTSILPGEGKTTTAVNIAAAMARGEKKVLLIDCDLRKPRIHKIFNLDNSKGVSTALSSSSDLKVVHRGPLDNLDIIPAGPVPPNPSELLGSSKFSRVIENLSKTYDIIIFDSPPSLSVSDIFLLNKVVDGAVVVVRSGRTTLDAMKKGLKSMNDMNFPITGIVLNAVDHRKSGYYYDYNYKQYYAYGGDSD